MHGAILTKWLSHPALLQADTFTELKWRDAFLAAMLGNAGSYYIGTSMGSRAL